MCVEGLGLLDWPGVISVAIPRRVESVKSLSFELSPLLEFPLRRLF